MDRQLAVQKEIAQRAAAAGVPTSMAAVAAAQRDATLEAERANAEQAQRVRCSRGQLDACDSTTRAAMEQQAAQTAQIQQQQEAIVAGQRADVERRSKLEWQLCYHTANKQQLQQGMAAERQNPSGVVNLRELNEYGKDIQAEDEMIAGLKKQFLQERRRAFTLKDCNGNYP